MHNKKIYKNTQEIGETIKYISRNLLLLLLFFVQFLPYLQTIR